MLVKSYGTSSWTERKTGQERSKFGPMYIHFISKCLEHFDGENYYGPRKRFDYKKIQVDKNTQEKLKEAEKAFLINLGVTSL